MNFNKDTIKGLAYLTKIALQDADAESIAKELFSMTEALSEFTSLNLNDVEPLYAIFDEPIAMREDEVADGGIADIITASAPEREGTFFVVPKVLE